MLRNNIELSAVLPSSHFSFPIIILSPQIGEHKLGCPLHVKPYSTKQAEEQPSSIKLILENNIKRSALLPSSHSSFPVRMRSPQVVKHTLGEFLQL